MSRFITRHHTNACNRAIRVEADDRDPANGNASHRYELAVMESSDPTLINGFAKWAAELRFQHGPIAKVGTNGITIEVLLAIAIDQLEGHQEGPYACPENEIALEQVLLALAALESRTKSRERRGVEGTHEV